MNRQETLEMQEWLANTEKKVMSGLKDFQKTTVNKVYELYRNGQNRVLVSDEVGLGKTMVARGAIIKFARMTAEKRMPVKVVYICSNASIAKQNLNKLRIDSDKVDISDAQCSRLSMLHLETYRQTVEKASDKYIQLIPLSPNTSFKMTGGTGVKEERALMFAILSHLPDIKQKKLNALEEVLKGEINSWETIREKAINDVSECDKESRGKYTRDMAKALTKELKREENGETLLDKILKINRLDSQAQKNVVKELRVVFAKISLEKLKPDLVILDEFQRFRFIIDDNSDCDDKTGDLISKFFDSNSDIKMLLLSATPYKMYSTLEEINESQASEHYSEFLKVMEFLNVADYEDLLGDYSAQLKEFCKDASCKERLLLAKRKLEDSLCKHICRTERASSEGADMIDGEYKEMPIKEITEEDIKSYVQFKKMLAQIKEIDDDGNNLNIPIDYIKSSPYILSFMDGGYKLKEHLEVWFRKHPGEAKILDEPLFWLRRDQINRYEEIPCNNARLSTVMESVFKSNAEKLLWMPPSKPYYPPQGVFEDAESFSKTIIFSSWAMVPRMASTLISYEAERRAIKKLDFQKDKEIRYFSKRGRPSERLKGPTTFCLMYPSLFLSSCYDPVKYMNKNLPLEEIVEREKTKQKIQEKIETLKIFSSAQSPEQNMAKKADGRRTDERWHYIAPLLLDNDEYANEWLEKNEDEGREFYKLKKLYENIKRGKETLGKQPKDLADVLIDMAVASPAICAMRLYYRYNKCRHVEKTYVRENFIDVVWPSEVAKLFVGYMNTPESTATIESVFGQNDKAPYWRKVLAYCKQGNFQAMLDEYAHLLANYLNDDDNLVENLHEAISSNLINLKTTTYDVDTYKAFKARIENEDADAENEKLRMRTHFAVAFAKGDDDESEANRKDSVRKAFNSPFRPFVLASTSIGQEGLDFHNYCRRIVHWNLPSNPIDLEQREGRINRFECLAIRQNIAKRYGSFQFEDISRNIRNIWEKFFEIAKKNEKGTSDLIPYWGLKDSKDMIKIERMVLCYPFSKDKDAYEILIKILSLYRLTLGQPRQNELMEYLIQNDADIKNMSDIFINLSPHFRNV